MVIVDIEAISLSEVAHLSQDFPGACIVCTHRVPDEAIWTAALQAGAADVCPTNDVIGIVRAAMGNTVWRRSAAA